MSMSSLPVEHLFTVRFLTRTDASPGHLAGSRIAVSVIGGEFTGPMLRGTVTAGSDWAVRRPDGVVSIDVRAQLRTDDGVTVFMTYFGLSTPGTSGNQRVLAAPRFDAPCDSQYAWLNDEVCVALGQVHDGAVEYEVYAVR
jgi:hypothetical protein